MMAHHVQNADVQLSLAGQHRIAAHGVRPHQHRLRMGQRSGLVQDIARNLRLADIMEEGGLRQEILRSRLQAEFQAEGGCQTSHGHAMLVGQVVVRQNHIEPGFHARLADGFHKDVARTFQGCRRNQRLTRTLTEDVAQRGAYGFAAGLQDLAIGYCVRRLRAGPQQRLDRRSENIGRSLTRQGHGCAGRLCLCLCQMARIAQEAQHGCVGSQADLKKGSPQALNGRDRVERGIADHKKVVVSEACQVMKSGQRTRCDGRHQCLQTRPLVHPIRQYQHTTDSPRRKHWRIQAILPWLPKLCSDMPLRHMVSRG